ncbi:TPA: autorepressor SdpR family transcription factor [Bacillus thuringiensis]|uniref:Transcriptional regulator n=3 Tax=Bacillus cereus group TaxID=86661 RepID=A0A9X6KJY3_BACTU|nr:MULTISPECIES: autorepressor SdpR family transcription factor [Bacillus cereus group]AGG05290.1 Transcriptional regulator [Bacillus thuringiensis serovar thuringiensis str. IS5056]AHZ54964.1 transcriptional repressor sdpR [Bacillus thuringiensis serovar kurstaki str. YBT-1520]AIE37413.1 transcriptional repressor sdpR [Bacillus thuringiensis serovar kurstaki str. HD-1]AIM34705.1 ArsR family transcriptional regulator [Bacillus thuringiensis serovar kurstaki str. YBT-1520]AJA23484.1 ArsR family
MNDLFKALADPTRRKILDLLKERDLTAGEIASHFNMSKPSISQHLNILKQSNLVKNRKEGKYVYYTLNTTVVQDILNWLISIKIGEENK